MLRILQEPPPLCGLLPSIDRGREREANSMVRIGLCLYLALSGLAGPWVCCCTAERLAAVFATQSSPLHCCGHRQSTTRSQKHGTLRQRTGDEVPPGRHSCPCEQSSSHQVLLVSLNSEVGKQDQFQHSLQALLGFLLYVPPTAERETLITAQGVHLPFLSAQDILRTLHKLRC